MYKYDCNFWFFFRSLIMAKKKLKIQKKKSIFFLNNLKGQLYLVKFNLCHQLRVNWVSIVSSCWREKKFSDQKYSAGNNDLLLKHPKTKHQQKLNFENTSTVKIQLVFLFILFNLLIMMNLHRSSHRIVIIMHNDN